MAREDVGRHNAVDKVIGRLLLDGRLPAHDLALAVTSRASFEIVQKAWAAGFTAVVAVSAPTALAVTAARGAGMTLAGFARAGRLNLYAPGAPGCLPGLAGSSGQRRMAAGAADRWDRAGHGHRRLLGGHPPGQTGQDLADAGAAALDEQHAGRPVEDVQRRLDAGHLAHRRAPGPR